MQEYDIIEFEDFNFNHYMHHYDECDEMSLHFEESYDCISAAATVIEEILWN